MIKKPSVLICDDDSEILRTLHLCLRSSYEVTTANNVNKAIDLASGADFDAAIIDLNFEGQEHDGIYLLDFLNKKKPVTFLIVLSGDTSTKRVIEATRRRLFEFIVKDENYFETLTSVLVKATSLSLAKKQNAQMKYLTQSSAVKDVLQKIECILNKQTDSSILIHGETGTGKEFLAQHIALNIKKKVVTANMGAIPKEMAESILFGHERGAFTGAIANQTGLIESAHNGLFFLDEIGECSEAVQAKLLRVLQEKEVQPLGSNRSKKINVQFIAATHRDLNQQVHEGKFRQDLLQRLNTFVLTLPALRDRPEDVIFYANLFLDDLSQDDVQFFITPEGEKALLSYRWPGNIRELRNVIERIVVFSSKTNIDAQTVNDAIALGNPPREIEVSLVAIVEANARKDEVIKSLTQTMGNKRKAAVQLGVSEATLYRWMKDLNLTHEFSSSAFKRKLGALA